MTESYRDSFVKTGSSNSITDHSRLSSAYHMSGANSDILGAAVAPQIRTPTPMTTSENSPSSPQMLHSNHVSAELSGVPVLVSSAGVCGTPGAKGEREEIVDRNSKPQCRYIHRCRIAGHELR